MSNISRRGALLCIGGVYSMVPVGSSEQEALAGPLSGTEETTQKNWFDAVIPAGTKAPEGALHLYRFSDEVYALTKPIAWVPDAHTKELKRVDVPEGFVTDFASVPRLFWSVLPRDGKYTYPAIVHDYMYWTQDVPRQVADEILRIGMDEFRVGSVTVNAIYWSVRAAGGWAWDANAALKERGEKRVLRKLPEEPLVSWLDWKKDTTVFK